MVRRNQKRTKERKERKANRPSVRQRGVEQEEIVAVNEIVVVAGRQTAR